MSYKIVRFYQDDRNPELVTTGLTLQQAKKHCNDPATRGDGWFDGYELESNVDPDFPDRPTHPDFKALSLAVIQNDGYADSGHTVEEVVAAADIDADSLFYMAKQRAMRMIRATPTPADTDELTGAMGATWIDGFMAGLKVGDGRRMVEIQQLLDGSLDDGNRRKRGE